MSPSTIKITVAGPFACFTRPEAKVERVSYSIMTPSAARNILDAICWRPEMRWVIVSLSVLKPVKFISILRNEVQNKISPITVKKWITDPKAYEPLAAGVGPGSEGTQRHSLILKDVAYIVEAYPLVFEKTGDNNPRKYFAMMERRVEKGQCFHRPALGCREFAADFRLSTSEDRPLPVTENLGRMLYDIAFGPDGNQPAFFDAVLEDGVLNTRPETVLSESQRREVLKCSYRR